MALKKVFAPHLGKNITLGRHRRPNHLRPVMRLAHYMASHSSSVLPTPPVNAEYWNKSSDAAMRQMYLNDQYGDCVIACGYHLIGLATGNATGKPFIASSAQILHDYSKIGGFNPSDPVNTDNGCNEQDALDYWTKTGFADGSKLLGWLAVDAKNHNEVMLALWLFENLVFGIELPDGWITPFPSADGFKWDVAGAPDMNNGHCVFGGGYDANKGVEIDTWALKGYITWAAMSYASASMGGELYVALTPDMLAKGQTKAPNGVDWSTIIADFNALGGHVPVPAPTPAPAPSPAPVVIPPGLTLAQAQAVASKGSNDALAAAWPKGAH